jgi:hypothetical protein
MNLTEVPQMAEKRKKLLHGDVKDFIKAMDAQKEEKRKSAPTMRSQKNHHKLST